MAKTKKQTKSKKRSKPTVLVPGFLKPLLKPRPKPEPKIDRSAKYYGFIKVHIPAKLMRPPNEKPKWRWDINREFVPETKKELFEAINVYVDYVIIDKLGQYKRMFRDKDQQAIVYQLAKRAAIRLGMTNSDSQGLSSEPITGLQDILLWCATTPRILAGKGKPKAEADNSVKDKDLRVGEIAKIVKRSPSRISQLCKDKKISSQGKGRKRRVSLNSALRYFAKINTDREDKETMRLGQYSKKDAADVARDRKKMNKTMSF